MKRSTKHVIGFFAVIGFLSTPFVITILAINLQNKGETMKIESCDDFLLQGEKYTLCHYVPKNPKKTNQ